MVRGDGWEGGLMRGWGVMLDCGIRECSNITLCFKEQWDWYRWTGIYQVRVQTLHNKPFGMRVNGHGTSCYWLVQTVWFLLLLCVNSCIRLSLVGIIVYSFISHNTTFPQHERSERVGLSACVKHGHVVPSKCCWSTHRIDQRCLLQHPNRTGNSWL